MGAYVVVPAVVPAVVPLGGGKRRREYECGSLEKRVEVSSLEGPGRKPRVHWLSVRRESGYGGTEDRTQGQEGNEAQVPRGQKNRESLGKQGRVAGPYGEGVPCPHVGCEQTGPECLRGHEML
jgi:hypothetical protein